MDKMTWSFAICSTSDKGEGSLTVYYLGRASKQPGGDLWLHVPRLDHLPVAAENGSLVVNSGT